jgi:sugar-specific transcriptional regulator TrmB
VLSKILTEFWEEVFLALNLKVEHARVYLALLENGASPASLIAKSSNVPRATAYHLLYELQKEGLCSVVKGETRQIFSASPPEKLKDLVTAREKGIEQTRQRVATKVSTLTSIFASHEATLPKVRFYEGEEGLKTVYYDGLSAKEILVICQGSPQTQTSLKDDPPYLKDFIRETMERKIPTQELLEDNPAVREYAAKYSSALHQILLMPRLRPAGPGRQKQIKAIGHVDKHIYGEKIAYISHDHLVGVIIEDATLAGSERAAFAVLWQHFARGKKNPAQRE